MKKVLTVVAPVYNEEENIDLFYRRVKEVLEEMKDKYDYEIILVNDGSKDNTPLKLDEIACEDKDVKIIHFTRNFGHQPAISCGINESRGDFVLVMDSDLQDPPEVIPSFVKKIEQGYDVVYAVRQKRKENFIKKFAYFLFYRGLKFISNIDIPLDSGDFGIINRATADRLKMLGEKKRFVRGLRTWVGGKQIGLEYERNARNAGLPKYTFKGLLKLALSGITGFSDFPLKLVSIFGFITSFIAFVLIIIFSITRYPIFGVTPIVMFVLLMGGLNIFFLGIVAEYISNIFEEIKGRPTYMIDKKVNF